MAVRNNQRTKAVLSNLDTIEKTDQIKGQQKEQPSMPTGEMQANQINIEQFGLFEDLVSRSYLGNLAECEIYPIDNDRKECEIRWYEITKIVLEKDTFSPDQLSMLYMSLHNVAKNVILVVKKSRQELVTRD